MSSLRTDRRTHQQLLAAASPLDAYALARLTSGSPMACAQSLRRLQAAGLVTTADDQDCADGGMSCSFHAEPLHRNQLDPQPPAYESHHGQLRSQAARTRP